MNNVALSLVVGIVALSGSGCCSMILCGSAQHQESLAGFRHAYQHDDCVSVTYATVRREAKHEVQRYVRLTPGATSRFYRGDVPRKFMQSPRPLLGVESREAALQCADKGQVSWWKYDPYSSWYYFGWYSDDVFREARMRVDHWYVPRSEYPRFVMLPLAVAVDVITSPIQLVVFGMVAIVDWEGPYGG